MFARILQFVPKMDKREELIRVIKRDVLPILKKQTGFLEILPFLPEIKNEHVVMVSLWNERKDFERYEREWFPKVEEMLQLLGWLGYARFSEIDRYPETTSLRGVDCTRQRNVVALPS